MLNTVQVGKTPQVGDKATDFTFPDTDMKPRSPTVFQGKKVALAFFVDAFTNVCTKEMCAFRDSMSRLIDLNAKVVGISVNDPFSNKGFVGSPPSIGPHPQPQRNRRNLTLRR
jgi:peroxiredoxin